MRQMAAALKPPGSVSRRRQRQMSLAACHSPDACRASPPSIPPAQCYARRSGFSFFDSRRAFLARRGGSRAAKAPEEISACSITRKRPARFQSCRRSARHDSPAPTRRVIPALLIFRIPRRRLLSPAIGKGASFQSKFTD